jgi:hypothetical protein
MLHKTLPEKLTRTEASKGSRLRWRDGVDHFEQGDHHRDAFNTGMTPAGDTVTGTG